MSPSRGSGRRLASVARHALVVAFAGLVVGVPIWTVVVNSLKARGEAQELGLSLPQHWQILENYGTVIDKGRLAGGLVTTLIIIIPSVICIVIASAAAAWIFARARSRTLTLVYFASIAGILIPTAIVASLEVLQVLGVASSLIGMILFYLGIFTSLGIFLITGFVKTIPVELEEAARIDGAGPFVVFGRVVFPLLWPVISTTSFLMVVFIWNDFFYPFFILPSGTQTMTLGLFNFASDTRYGVYWNLVFADVVLISVPLIILFVFAQRSIVSGFLGTAGK